MTNVPNTTASSGGGGLGLGFFGMLSGAMVASIGAYYAAKSAKYETKSQALSAEFASSMASLNAHQAEEDANAILAAGRQEKAALTLQQGEERAAVEVGQAASGTMTGTGSNAEVLASQRLIHRIDSLTLDSNTLRAANNARTRGVNARNESSLLAVSARNLRGAAGSISPGLAAASSLLGSTGTISSRWAYNGHY